MQCQRCGRACTGTLCSTCRNAATAHQSPEKKSPSASRPRQKRDRGTEPPARVVETYKAVGSLQLHRLGGKVNFYCVTCRRRQGGNLVATADGDWKQTLCNVCYRALVAQGRTGKGVSQNWRPGKMARQRGKKTFSGPSQKPGSLTKETPVRGERDQPTRQQPLWIHSQLEFFREAGINAHLEPTRRLRIDGRDIDFRKEPLSREVADWSDITNQIVLEHLYDEFVSAVRENASFIETLDASLSPRPKGVAVMQGEERLGVIRPAHASIPHHHLIHGNFLVSGPHWRQVYDALRDEARQPARSIGTAGTKQRRFNQLPVSLAKELKRACLDASRRIRLERRLDYGDTPVILECDVGELTLLPITGPENRLLFPFRFRRDAKTLPGALILINRDPLPLMIGADVGDEDAITAWTCALLGFADATCIDLERRGQAARRETVKTRSHPSSKVRRTAPQRRSVQSRHRWPTYLEPVGDTARHIDSLVRGHRRHLPDGWTASVEACDRARRIGIILRAEETWVQPHPRGHGMPVGVEMRFSWHAPAELMHMR